CRDPVYPLSVRIRVHPWHFFGGTRGAREQARSPVMKTSVSALAWLALAAACIVASVDGRVAIKAAEPAAPRIRVAGIVLKWVRADKEANYRRLEPLI